MEAQGIVVVALLVLSAVIGIGGVWVIEKKPARKSGPEN